MLDANDEIKTTKKHWWIRNVLNFLLSIAIITRCALVFLFVTFTFYFSQRVFTRFSSLLLSHTWESLQRSDLFTWKIDTDNRSMWIASRDIASCNIFRMFLCTLFTINPQIILGKLSFEMLDFSCVFFSSSTQKHTKKYSEWRFQIFALEIFLLLCWIEYSMWKIAPHTDEAKKINHSKFLNFT